MRRERNRSPGSAYQDHPYTFIMVNPTVATQREQETTIDFIETTHLEASVDFVEGVVDVNGIGYNWIGSSSIGDLEVDEITYRFSQEERLVLRQLEGEDAIAYSEMIYRKNKLTDFVYEMVKEDIEEAFDLEDAKMLWN